MKRFHKIIPMFGSIIMLIGLLSLEACLPKSKPQTNVKNQSVTDGLDRCVAIRGNGTHMVAHTTALAKITLRWGELNALAGGSSATISTFLYESILLNPAVKSLPSSDRPRAIALLLKSILGFGKETSSEVEWRALRSLGSLAARIESEGVLSLPLDDYKKSADNLRQIFANKDLTNVINPEILRLLLPSPDSMNRDYEARVEEVKKSAASLTKLDGSDPDVFFRSGLLNFPHFVNLVGRVGDFYAGYGPPQPKMSGFIRDCMTGTEEQTWSELAAKPVQNETCGQKFAEIVRAWKNEFQSSEQRVSRLDDSPGLALRSIMITSIVEREEAIQRLRKFDDLYRQGLPRELAFNFDDVKFGYWVSHGIINDPVANWQNTSPDGKSKKAINLGPAKAWRDILLKSPVEPSLGKYTEFSPMESRSGIISLGGWADLHPVQILKAAGCDKVIYLTRRTAETQFITKGPAFDGRKPSGLAELLGMTNRDYDDIYSLDNPSSGFSVALKKADGVWCTRWNEFTAKQQDEIANDGWSAPLLSGDSQLASWPETDKSNQQVLGCR